LSLIGLVYYLPSYGQKENYNWYFGKRAGLTFTTDTPSALTDGMMTTQEGCGAISDGAGNLLFYTDGITVYDRKHMPMLNGQNLYGNPSSTQCGIIQQKPGDKNLYYVFSLNENGGRFSYSVVDMRLNNGYGDVITNLKNIELAPEATEKLVLIRKSSGLDYWVIAHAVQSDEFLVYELTSQGVSPTPKTVKAGVRHGGNRGYMRASPDGSMIACAYIGPQIDPSYHSGVAIDLLKFDRATGNLILLHTFPVGVYGLEFSPNGKYLYSAPRGPGSIHQFNVTTYTDATITMASPSIYFGALQNGPDGKLYIAQTNSKYLGMIEFPDKPGVACGYKKNALYLGGRTCTEGLPGFTSRPLDLYYADTCFGEETNFFVDGTTDRKLLWKFNDPGTNDTATSTNPTHRFSKPGNYTIVLTLSKNGITDTLTKNITIGTPPVSLKQTKERICPGDSVYLDAGNPYASIKWSTGDTKHGIWVKNAGLYTVIMQHDACTLTDTVLVEIKDTVTVSLGPDTTYCADEEVELNAGPKADAYLWSTGETSRTILITKPGIYWVVKSLEGCAAYDTVNIGFYVKPDALVSDTFLCEAFQDSIRLTAKEGKNYAWTGINGSGGSVIVHKAGVYSVTYDYGNGCPVTQIFRVENRCPHRLYVPNAFHPEGEVEANRVFKPYGLDINTYEMKIYNRWGELLFTSESLDKGWDGTFRNTMCEDGIYLYEIYYTAPESNRLFYDFLSGTVRLLR
jgi:gliding motility-associated-like protein